MKVLGIGDRLPTNVAAWDETGRFQLILQSDGNLVVYASVLEGTNLKRRPVFATGTDPLGLCQYVELRLPANIVFKKSNGSEHVWYNYGHLVHGTNWPDAELHMQADGNLVLYADHGSNPIWNCHPLDQAAQRNVLPPGTLTIDIGDSRITPTGEKVITNNTDGNIAVRDDEKIIVLKPNDSATASNPSSLGIPYSLSITSILADSTGSSASAGGSRIYGPSERNVSIVKGVGGYGLA